MSSIGTLLKLSTFGESHGIGVGCILDGIPANLPLTELDVQPQLTRRRPGQSALTTPRNEADTVTILSGTENGLTLGTPIAMMVKNQDQRKFDYANTKEAPRPGHADYTYQVKYGLKATSGGGRASARETIGRVAAGAVAEKWMAQEYGMVISCWVSSVMNIDMPKDVAAALEADPPTREEIDTVGTLSEDVEKGVLTDMYGRKYSSKDGAPLDPSEVPADSLDFASGKMLYTRCPHPPTAAKMCAVIQQLRKEEDSTGGIVTCVVSGVPVGLGEPCFDKLEAELAKAMMSLPATKAFEIGQGFNCCRMRGSENNDLFVKGENGLLHSATNNAGGTLGGITSGEPIVFRVGIKPASSISQEQKTAHFDGTASVLLVKGRHDPCVLPRVPPLIEGMAALTMMDAALRQRARSGAPLQLLGESVKAKGVATEAFAQPPAKVRKLA
ncbi:unnamed protein product [Polarella glacialis]|uniref:Chorismate synthase n=1 Tax=Polarella glacialis TaxID=89957 RepID=A0A813EX37_POLGL|nr:unnamed protein product [Polarella glacialis]